MNAERVSEFYTGIPINSNLTTAAAGLGANPGISGSLRLEQRVFLLNDRAMSLARALADFKSHILNSVIACRLFTVNYPLLLDHILREARFYLMMLTKLQNREEILSQKGLIDQEVFWNRIMAEHSKFIRGLLDPTEVKLIGTAENFGREFDELTNAAIAAHDQSLNSSNVTRDSLKAANGIKDFKAAGTKGLIDCSIKSIIIPLLGDHVLREANHYIRILNQYSTIP
jgi:hypothetical protein